MVKRSRKQSKLLSGCAKRPGISVLQKSEKRIPKTLKPLRARQLIRRFHVLIKYRNSILNKLQILVKADDTNFEETYKCYIISNKDLKKVYKEEWEKRWKELKINKTPESVIDPRTNDHIKGNETKEDLVKVLGRIDSEIEKRGGLETYQIASTLGQDGKRGGDSSKMLVKWLKELQWKASKGTALEIGCLSSTNEISKSKIFDRITRIDLHSQEPGLIEEQDFLERPRPENESEKFDCISCSLVVNFVPNPEQRGEMLCRICEFLNEPDKLNNRSLLFFVIPLPCVENSRYFDVSLMNLVFEKLGFEQVKYHKTHKLAYWLLSWKGSSHVDLKFTLKKKEILSGGNRNNFCIVIK